MRWLEATGRIALAVACVAAALALTPAAHAQGDAEQRMRQLAERMAGESLEAPDASNHEANTISGGTLVEDESADSAASVAAPAAAPLTPITEQKLPLVRTGPSESASLGTPSPRAEQALRSPAIRADEAEVPLSPPGESSWVLSTAAALGVVIALILGMRWLLVRMRGGVALAGRSPVVEVLSRSTVGPKSSVLLLRVGSRVLIVGDSSGNGGSLNTLAEVQDEQEIASLLQAVEAARPQSMTHSFQGVFSRLNKQFDGDEPTDAMHEGLDSHEHRVDRVRDSLSVLRGKLRLGSQQAAGGER